MKLNYDVLPPTVLSAIICQMQFATTLCVDCATNTFKYGCAETELTLAKTMEITQSMEAADRNAQKLKVNELNLRVSEISLGTQKSCYRCGVSSIDPEHALTEKESVVTKNKGHLARMYQSKSRTGHKAPSQGRANPSRKGSCTGTTKRETNWLTVTEETQTEPEPFSDSTILNIGSHRDIPITVQLKLD